MEQNAAFTASIIARASLQKNLRNLVSGFKLAALLPDASYVNPIIIREIHEVSAQRTEKRTGVDHRGSRGLDPDSGKMNVPGHDHLGGRALRQRERRGGNRKFTPRLQHGENLSGRKKGIPKTVQLRPETRGRRINRRPHDPRRLPGDAKSRAQFPIVGRGITREQFIHDPSQFRSLPAPRSKVVETNVAMRHPHAPIGQ